MKTLIHVALLQLVLFWIIINFAIDVGEGIGTGASIFTIPWDVMAVTALAVYLEVATFVWPIARRAVFGAPPAPPVSNVEQEARAFLRILVASNGKSELDMVKPAARKLLKAWEQVD